MLNAEHVALESRLVQQMVAIRQREMDNLLTRYSAIGTQASLLAGFAVTQLTALSPSEDTVHDAVEYAFYLTSLTCVLCSMHVVTCTMYVCNWAPRLALRGPTGSLTRAFEATRSEKQQINIMFTTSVVAFALQTVAAIWVMDQHLGWTPHALYASVLTGGLVLFDVYYFMGIHARFFGQHNEWGKNYNVYQQGVLPETDVAPRLPSSHLNDAQRRHSSVNPGSLNAPLLITATTAGAATGPGSSGAASSSNGGGSSGSGAGSETATPPQLAESPAGRSARRGSMLNNPLAHIETNPDAMVLNERAMAGVHRAMVAGSSASELNMAGLLSKRSQQPGERFGSRAASLTRRLSNTVTGEWRERYFVLRDGTLNYWGSEADYEADKPGALERPIDLTGHEVLVDTDSPKWAFTIAPCSDERGLRTWYLRAPTEEARLAWARKLVLNSLLHAES